VLRRTAAQAPARCGVHRLIAEDAEVMGRVQRILYLWANPTHAVISLFRRGYAGSQARKLNQQLITDTDDFTAAFPKNISAYADAEPEAFQMEQHFDSFKNQGQV
jgi:hypothetical protein